jgi:glutamyl-tRNA synthetase
VYVGRYAPSPTGDLHLGNARTALLAWLSARRAGGRFLLRFEDLDSARVRPGCARQQAESLAWLGLDWDGAPVWQSERTEGYEAALAALRERGVLYECFCSRADVRRAASAPHGPDGPIYGGVCRELTAEERAQRRLLGREPSLRVRMQGASGDIVVRRGDGVVAYQLAVAVDDAAQGVTHVVRGADLADSTARQLELYRLLSLEPVPGHTHVPLNSAPTASAWPSATALSGSRSCTRRAPTRARSPAGSLTAPACSRVLGRARLRSSSRASTRRP